MVDAREKLDEIVWQVPQSSDGVFENSVFVNQRVDMIGLSSYHINEIENDCSVPSNCENDDQFFNLNDDFSLNNLNNGDPPTDMSNLADLLDNMATSTSYINFALEKGLLLDPSVPIDAFNPDEMSFEEF